MQRTWVDPRRFSQYLNNLTNLNDAAIIKLANFLDVDPIEIDADFEKRAGIRWKRLPKASSLTGLQDPSSKAQYFDNSIMNHAQLIYCDVDLIPIACKGSHLIVCHERHINMQTRLSNMQHDLFGLYQEHNDGPWLCPPYVEIPDDIPSEQKRVVIATLWI